MHVIASFGAWPGLGWSTMAATLGAVAWMAPWWAWALVAAVALPALAHWMNQPRVRMGQLPTLRFLVQALVPARRRRLRDGALLLLRVLALSLVVAAFAGPVWQAPQAIARAGVRGVGVTAVFLLDRSASMNALAHSPPGATLFDTARQRVRQELDRLDPTRDRAAVVLVDGAPGPLLPEATARFDLLQQALANVEPTHHVGRWADAIQAAKRFQEAAPATKPGQARRTLRLTMVSDAQATGFAGVGPARVAIELIAVEPKAEDNLAVRAARPSPANPVVGAPATLTAEAVWHTRETLGPGATRQAWVELMVDGQATARQALTLRPNTPSLASFRWTPLRPGPAALVVKIAPTWNNAEQTLFTDDEAGLFAWVRPGWEVAIVSQAREDDTARASYYLVRALAPRAQGDPADAALGGVRARIVKPGEIEEALGIGAGVGPSLTLAARREAPDAVVVADVGDMGEAALAALRRYLFEGGSALWIVDSPASAAALAGLAQGGAAGSPIVGDAAGWVAAPGLSVTLAPAIPEHPLLDVFQGPARATLARARWGSRWRGSLAQDALPLLRFADQSPALAIRWTGPGRLAVLAADLSPGSSDLVQQPSFLALVHQLTRGLHQGQPSPPNPRPGGPALATTWPMPSGASAQPSRWIGPGGLDLTSDANPGRASPSPRETLPERVATPELSLPGAYRWLGPNDRPLAAVYAELDPAESDPRRRPEVEQAFLAGPVETPQAVSAADAASLDAQPPRGEPLWPHALAAALALLAVEPWMARRQPM